MADTRSLPVPDGLDGERVDAGLARLLGLSRSAVAAIVGTGGVRVDGREAGKSDRLVGGTWIEVDLPGAPEPVRVVPETVDGLRVVHDDDDLVVVDKPVGVAAHPSRAGPGRRWSAGWPRLGYRISTSGAAERQGVVHRLDVGTSGLMVVAKSEHGYTVLKRAFQERTVDKVYHAVVQGLPDPVSGTVDAPIGRHPSSDWKWAVTREGKPSVTHYELLEAFRSATLLEIHLETGRTHQIRVHISALRHPCVGDLTYGADPTLATRLGLTRQWLHAHRLGFDHPVDGGAGRVRERLPVRPGGGAGAAARHRVRAGPDGSAEDD